MVEFGELKQGSQDGGIHLKGAIGALQSPMFLVIGCQPMPGRDPFPQAPPSAFRLQGSLTATLNLPFNWMPVCAKGSLATRKRL